MVKNLEATIVASHKFSLNISSNVKFEIQLMYLYKEKFLKNSFNMFQVQLSNIACWLAHWRWNAMLFSQL